ncbi:ABC exporter membrane fusion protein [Nodularia sp. LEGE 06071]|nr:ABC exporter membrane fusion protein [Nodularia sp. LEGE 06071]MCC2692679.1 ABC exporter membrane fusion protein [Nodularia sp. LEGE 04288]
MKLIPEFKKHSRLQVNITVFALIVISGIGGIILYRSFLVGSEENILQDDFTTIEKPELIKALGRLEPKDKVIKLSAPTPNISEASRVEKLLVKHGDKVRVGQTIAILDSQERLLAALEKAKQEVAVAKAHLAQVKAGAKPGEVNAQIANITRQESEKIGQMNILKAEIAGLEAELSNAKIEDNRYKLLFANGAISASTRDNRRLVVESITQQLNQAQANQKRIQEVQKEQLKAAKATLNSIKEVRLVDIQAAQAQVNNVQAAVKQAQANLNLAYIKAPKDGQILKIHALPGETVSQKGIVELGQTDQMYVVAEVYETDVSNVRVGQKATITSSAFVGELQGNVDEIGLQIGKTDILGTDPAAKRDARVVEVKISLDQASSKKVGNLTYLEVTAVIHL